MACPFGAREDHGMKSECTGTRAQTMALGPLAIPRACNRPNQQNHIVSGSGAQLLLKHKVSQGPGQGGGNHSDSPPGQPCRFQEDAHDLCRVCELEPYSGARRCLGQES